MTMNSMRELLVHELQDLLSAEMQLIKALPAMATAANSPKLAAAFREHLTQSNVHIGRLDECFTLLGEERKAVKCKGMEGLLKEGAEMAEEEGNPLVRDAGLIGAAQRVEHYEMAAYGTCVELAVVLGEQPVAELLRNTLEEEKATDLLLTDIANDEVNPKAMLSSEQVSAK